MTGASNADARRFELTTSYIPRGDQPAAIEALVANYRQGLVNQTMLGVTGSGKTYTMACVMAELQVPTVVLAPNKILAAQLYGEMREFLAHNAVEYFVSYYDYYQPEAYVPSSDTYIEKDASINDHLDQMRLSATKALMERKDCVIVASVSAIYGLGDPKTYMQMQLHLSVGDTTGARDIMRRLVDLQYARNDFELRRGTFRVRGDVIDVFPADAARHAYRVELFDDEVESLSRFDPITGIKEESLQRLTVYPKSHYVTPPDVIDRVVFEIGEELDQQLSNFKDQGKLVEAQRLEQRTRLDMEMLQEFGTCPGVENYSRFLSGRAPGEASPTLFEYLPKDALVIVDESHVTLPQLRAMYRGDRARKQTLVEYGFRVPSALDNRPLKFEEWEACAPQRIFASATPGPYEKEQSSAVVELVVRPTGLLDPRVEVRPATDQVSDLLSECNERVKKHERVLVTTLTKRMSEELADYLAQHGIKVRYMHSEIDALERVSILRDLRAGVFDVLVGINLLREGLDVPEVSLVAILDADRPGFLRSRDAMVQTIGRAARHLHGTAILYGDIITPAMQEAIDETDRRRAKQEIFNQKHGITPHSVVKAVRTALSDSDMGNTRTPQRQGMQKVDRHDPLFTDATLAVVSKKDLRSALIDPSKLDTVLKKLEKAMNTKAESLEFESAAALRDAADNLRERSLTSGQ